MARLSHLHDNDVRKDLSIDLDARQGVDEHGEVSAAAGVY